MYVDSSDMEIVYESEGNPPSDEQVIGWRWMVPVPKGATITKAYLEIECDETKNGKDPVNVIIAGQLIANAPVFTTDTANITSRAQTKAQVKWSMAPWVAENDHLRSPDLSAILQEIIDQADWKGGNALALSLRDDKSNPSTGIRCSEAYEGEPTAATLLHIEVFNPAANTPNPKDGALDVFLPLFGWDKGDGAILHNVYVGKTADLTPANLVSPNLPFTTYYYVQGLEPGGTYYWRVDEVDAAGKVTAGPVWSFVAQAETAYYPAPVNGAVDVPVAPVLTWLPGQATLKHHVYVGDSLDAVTQGAAGTDQGELDLAKAAFALTGLNTVTTYHWRVDEILASGAVKAGPVWSFTTYLPVDDFESYTDNEGSRIYEAWIDGWTNNSGATVGNTTAPFAEKTIVRSGQQSMPMDYNNAKTPFYSQAYQEFASPQDWTVNGLADLRLAFRGRAANGADSLYVAVEDSSGKSAVVANPAPDAVTTTTWTEWKIPLSSLTGVNLAKVKRLYIGLGDSENPVAGGAGRIYLDDIRVTKP